MIGQGQHGHGEKNGCAEKQHKCQGKMLFRRSTDLLGNKPKHPNVCQESQNRHQAQCPHIPANNF